MNYQIGELCDLPCRENHRSYEAMVESLAGTAEHTTLHPLLPAEELLLNEQSQTVNGYRYTQQALQQLAGFLAHRFWWVLASLSGQTISENYRPDNYSPEFAREIFNRTLMLRYSDLPWQRTLICHQTRHIEGFMKSGYRHVDNFQVLERMHASLPPTGGWRFVMGLQLGRRIAAWYRRGDTAAVTVGVERHAYWSGLYVGCGESYAATAYATPAMLWNRGSSLQPMQRTNRVAHYGASFMQSVAELIQQQARMVPGAATWVTAAYVAQRRPLGFNESTSDEAKRHISRWIGRLQRTELSSTMARHILLAVLRFGSSLETADTESSEFRQTTVDRTYYDFYCQLTAAARSLPPTTRERVEQLAHTLIVS